MDINKSIQFLSLLLILLFLHGSCKKMIEISEPSTQLTRDKVFSNEETALTALNSIYAQMEGDQLLYQIERNAGLSGDELINFSFQPDATDMAANSLTAQNVFVSGLWSNLYRYIFQANAIIEGLRLSEGISAESKKSIEGEALFVRALSNYYLVSFFGSIPLVETTDYILNSTLPRASASEVYQSIILDLEKAADQLPAEYGQLIGNASGERVRPNAYVASALLTRVFQYTENWSGSAAEATRVIGANDIYALSPALNQVFLMDSREAIWQLQSNSLFGNTNEGANFIITDVPSNVAISTNLLSEFYGVDQRKENWIGRYDTGSDIAFFPFKYKQVAFSDQREYVIVLRLAEQYLIRAEDRLNLGDSEGAINDLNIIRNRAGLSSLAGLDPGALADSIQLESARELFCEGGTRWFNLKRLGKANDILSPIKGTNWSVNDQLYPIPQDEILRNPALVQNPGY